MQGSIKYAIVVIGGKFLYIGEPFNRWAKKQHALDEIEVVYIDCFLTWDFFLCINFILYGKYCQHLSLSPYRVRHSSVSCILYARRC